MRRRRWHGDRPLPYFLLQIIYRLLELRILAAEGSMRCIIHDYVGIHPMAFDEPFALRSVHPILGSGRDALIHQPIVERKPDLPAPGARADDLAQSKPLKAFGECLAV